MKSQSIQHRHHDEPEQMRDITPESRALEFVQGHQGQPLAGATRDFLEPKFAHNFGDVRVFADGQASNLAHDLDAKAFTVGQNIVFGSGEYQPHAPNGLGLLAHELTHTVQQKGADLKSVNQLEVANRSSPLEREARAVSDSATFGRGMPMLSSSNAVIAREEKEAGGGAPNREQQWRGWLGRVDQNTEFATSHDDRAQMHGKNQKDTLLKDARSSGAREGSMASEGISLFQDIQIPNAKDLYPGERDKIATAVELWNVFRIPMGLTLKSLGRVQDLLTAGAPQTPAAMPKPQQEKLGHVNKETEDAFDGLSDKVTNLDSAMAGYMGLLTELEGARKEFESTQQILLGRKKKAEQNQTKEELRKLEEPYDTLVKIIDTIDSARGVAKTLIGGGELELMKEGGEKAAGLLPSKKEIFMLLGGDAKKAGSLRQQIEKLEHQIAVAGLNAENLHINAAKDQLSGVTEQSLSAALNVGAATSQSRQAAMKFGSRVGGGDPSKLAALVSEAYQELRIFGNAANEKLGPLAPKIGVLWNVLSEHHGRIEMDHQHPASEFMDRGYSDFDDLIELRQKTIQYGALLEQYLPEWTQHANTWRSFFNKSGHGEMDEYQAQRDKL
jgi:Domain of unknown function (DUF4157)